MTTTAERTEQAQAAAKVYVVCTTLGTSKKKHGGGDDFDLLVSLTGHIPEGEESIDAWTWLYQANKRDQQVYVGDPQHGDLATISKVNSKRIGPPTFTLVFTNPSSACWNRLRKHLEVGFDDRSVPVSEGQLRMPEDEGEGQSGA